MLKQENFYTCAGFHMLFCIICEWYCWLYCLASKRSIIFKICKISAFTGLPRCKVEECGNSHFFILLLVCDHNPLHLQETWLNFPIEHCLCLEIQLSHLPLIFRLSHRYNKILLSPLQFHFSLCPRSTYSLKLMPQTSGC